MKNNNSSQMDWKNSSQIDWKNSLQKNIRNIVFATTLWLLWWWINDSKAELLIPSNSVNNTEISQENINWKICNKNNDIDQNIESNKVQINTTLSLDGKKQQENIVKWEARSNMKELITNVSFNPFTISQQQWEQYTQSNEIITDTSLEKSASSTSKGGGGIDSKKNLDLINSQINDIKLKISGIESKKNFWENDKDFDEVDALNKKLIELEDKKTAEAIKSKQEKREDVIKSKQDQREDVIKHEDKTTEDVIKSKQAQREKIIREFDEKISIQEVTLKKINTIKWLIK